MRGVWLAGWMGAAACTSGSDLDVPIDTDPDVVGCDGNGVPVLQVAQDLTDGTMVDGTPIAYGNPPQGGAPYAPFQIRMRAQLDGQRASVSATAVNSETDQEVGSALQEQGFLCSNTGTHEGWLYGGEVHVRFWGWGLEELEGMPLRITVEVALPDDQTAQTVFDGALAWTL